jgi:hypothetical protein
MGGYQLVDFKDINLTTNAVKIEGVYETIESNNRKPLLLHNGVVNNVERADCYAFCVVDGTDFKLYYGNPAYYIKVTDEDMVSLVSI